MFRILGFHCRGLGSIPGQGTEISQAMQCSQKKKKREKNSFYVLKKNCIILRIPEILI